MFINLFAELANLSRSGVRFLEKSGIITSQSNESGYRVFSENDLIRLKLFQSFRNLGFTQKQSLGMGSLDAVERLGALEKRKREMETEFEETFARLNAEIQAVADATRLVRPCLACRPAFFALPSGREEMPSTMRKPLERSGVRWWNEIPDVSFGLVCREVSDGTRSFERCALIEVSKMPAESESLLEGAFLLPACDCMCARIHGMIDGSDLPAVPEVPEDVVRAARDQGLGVMFDGAVSRVVFARIDESKTEVVAQTWFPLTCAALASRAQNA